MNAVYTDQLRQTTDQRGGAKAPQMKAADPKEQVEALLRALRASTNGNGLASKAVDAAMSQCASQLLQEAVEAELERYLQQFRQKSEWAGLPPVVRNGHHPERMFVTSIGPVSIRIPKLRGRHASMPAFESVLLPRYQRRADVANTGAQWRFLSSLAKCDWAALFVGLLGLNGARVTDLPQANRRWQRCEDRVVLVATQLEAGDWSDLRTKAFAAPADYRLRESLGDPNGKQTILAVAAQDAEGQWQLIECRLTDRISGEVWQSVAGELSAQGFALAGEHRTPESNTRFDAVFSESHHQTEQSIETGETK
jgi:hypothetical protein